MLDYQQLILMDIPIESSLEYLEGIEKEKLINFENLFF
jgi:hypothetical protein